MLLGALYPFSTESSPLNHTVELSTNDDDEQKEERSVSVERDTTTTTAAAVIRVVEDHLSNASDFIDHRYRLTRAALTVCALLEMGLGTVRVVGTTGTSMGGATLLGRIG